MGARSGVMALVDVVDQRDDRGIEAVIGPTRRY